MFLARFTGMALLAILTAGAALSGACLAPPSTTLDDRLAGKAPVALEIGVALTSPSQGVSSGATTQHAADPFALDEDALLREAPLVALAAQEVPRPGAPTETWPSPPKLVFRATVAMPNGSRNASLVVAERAAPLAYKPSLAFYRLSRTLGFHVVPAATLRRVSVGALAGWLGPRTDASALLGLVAAQSDGTVDALLSVGAPSDPADTSDMSSSAPLRTPTAFEVVRWDRMLRGELTPTPAERALLRSYLEMLVLDYLSANWCRRTVTLASQALLLDDNRSAFPSPSDHGLLLKGLRKLRAARIIPVDLVAGLRSLTLDRMDAIFVPDDPENSLLSRRQLVELNERRLALVSLFQARLASAASLPVER
jgi:hypothetical protein